MRLQTSASTSRRFNRTRVSLALISGLIVLYILVFGTLTILKHRALQTTAFDLGTMDQAIWNTSQGRILQVTIQPGVNIRLAGHVEPILLVISLLYLLYSDPQILLALQTIIVALGALPIYWLAKERLSSDLAALVFSSAFLLFPALEAANMFDFHGVTLAATFLTFAFYFAKREKGRALFLVFMLLTMSCREDMSLLVMMMGLYLVLKWRGLRKQGSFRNPLTLDRDNWLLGVVTLVIGASWFIVALFIIPSHFSISGQHSQWDRYGYLGESVLEMLGTLLFRPDIVLQHLVTRENLYYMLGLLSPVAFLSLLAPQVLLLGLPTLLMNLLSTYAPMHTLGPFHYAAPLVPFFVMASIYGTALLTRLVAPRIRVSESRLVQVFSCLVLLSSLVVHYHQGYSPLAADFVVPIVTAHESLADTFLIMIPPDAAVSAQSRLVPHLSQRERIYMFPRIEDAEYVFFDVTVDSWPIHPNDQWRLFQSLIDEEGFGILAAEDGYILLQRGLSGADELSNAFYDFARREEPQIEYPTVIEFGDALRLLGFDLLREGNMTSLSLYWEALRPLERDYRIYPFFYDEAGNIIEDTTLRPMTTGIWYSTSKWRPGETVWMQTLPWDVGTDFNVGLGVIDGEDWRIQEDRLAANVVTSTLRLRLFEQDTAAQLAEVRDGEIITTRRLFASPLVSHPSYANLGNQVSLLGYDLRPISPSPGSTIYLDLYWQARVDMDVDYTVFTHLIGEGEGIVAQHDSQPEAGYYPTSQWLGGEIVQDEHALILEPGLRPGEYTLVVGMYDLQRGERLPTYDQNGVLMPQNRIVLTRIQLGE
jgi:uncharacterized membrane protein